MPMDREGRERKREAFLQENAARVAASKIAQVAAPGKATVSKTVGLLALPIFNGHLMSSMLGVMAFPDDLEKAETCACWYMAQEPLERLIEHGEARREMDETLPAGISFAAAIMNNSAKFAPLFEEWSRAMDDGNVVGAVTLSLVSLIEENPQSAGWERAILYVVDNSKERPLNRSQLWGLKAKFTKVFHLWGAWYDCRGLLPHELVFAAKAAELCDVVSNWTDRNSKELNQGSLWERVYQAPVLVDPGEYRGDLISLRLHSIDLSRVSPRGKGGRPARKGPKPLS